MSQLSVYFPIHATSSMIIPVERYHYKRNCNGIKNGASHEIKKVQSDFCEIPTLIHVVVAFIFHTNSRDELDL